MREQIHRLIEQARRPQTGLDASAGADPALRLAAETVRLARLAASAHLAALAGPASGERAAGRGRPRT